MLLSPTANSLIRWILDSFLPFHYFKSLQILELSVHPSFLWLASGSSFWWFVRDCRPTFARFIPPHRVSNPLDYLSHHVIKDALVISLIFGFSFYAIHFLRSQTLSHRSKRSTRERDPMINDYNNPFIILSISDEQNERVVRNGFQNTSSTHVSISLYRGSTYVIGRSTRDACNRPRKSTFTRPKARK